MKPREPRQSIMVPVRVRQDARWKDATIRNVSSRGMMLQMNEPPPRGSYIELRRGEIVMIGQIRWARDDRCGVRTQDVVPLSRLTSGAAPAAAARFREGAVVERRATVRVLSPAEAAERSRIRGALFQKLSLAGAGVVGALILAMLTYGVMSRPFAAIARHLR